MKDPKDMESDPLYDAVVVGAGAAGLSAALVLGRARRRVVVVDGGAPRNAAAPHMHGYLSRDGMPPSELLAVGRAEIARYGVKLIEDRVDRVDQVPRVDRAGPGFAVHLATGAVLQARRLVVATGVHDEMPDIPGIEEGWGGDVLHCPYCHGYEVRDEPIGVVAFGPEAVHQVLILSQWSDDVVFFSHTVEPTGEEREQLAAFDVRVVDGEVTRLAMADGRLRGVEVRGVHLVPRGAVFLFPETVPNDSLLVELGCEKGDDGWVTTATSGRTSVPTVWAAGNVADPAAQVITAASGGSAAAMAVNKDLVDEDTARAVELRRAGKTASQVSQPRAEIGEGS